MSDIDLEFWDTISKNYLYKSPRINLRVDTCKLPDGRIVKDYVVGEIPDGVTVVAITASQELLLVKQYKHGIDKIVLELPAGNVDNGEEPLVAIRRELLEETGYEAKEVEFVSTLCSKPARFSALTHVYYATDVQPFNKKENQDSSEVIEVITVPISQLPSLISKGDIITETSLAALLLSWGRLFKTI